MVAGFGLDTQALRRSDGFLAEITQEGGPFLLVMVQANNHESGPRLLVHSFKVDGDSIEIMKPDLTLERFERSDENLEILKMVLKETLGYQVYIETFSDPV